MDIFRMPLIFFFLFPPDVPNIFHPFPPKLKEGQDSS